MTFRDRNDKRVFMQNLRSWYLMSGSAQTRIWSMLAPFAPFLLRFAKTVCSISVVGEEWEDGQQQEPTKECDDWGLYGQAMDGDGYHPSCNLC